MYLHFQWKSHSIKSRVIWHTSIYVCMCVYLYIMCIYVYVCKYVSLGKNIAVLYEYAMIWDYTCVIPHIYIHFNVQCKLCTFDVTRELYVIYHSYIIHTSVLLYGVFHKVYDVHCTSYIIRRTVYTVDRTLYIVRYQCTHILFIHVYSYFYIGCFDNIRSTIYNIYIQYTFIICIYEIWK